MQMVKVNSKVCSRCKYRINVEQKPCCNYIEVEGHSRIFEDGELKYDPKYCDKYCPGARITNCNIEFHNVEYDEYDQYKADRVGREKSGQP